MPQPHEFDQMLAIAQNEIHRDAPRIAKTLDLSADATQLSEPEMVDQMRRNWSNPQYRAQIQGAMAPDKFVGLYLKASNATNPDGTPMTVAQYQKQLNSAPTTPPVQQPPNEALAPSGVHAPDPVANAIAASPDGAPFAPPTGGSPQPQ